MDAIGLNNTIMNAAQQSRQGAADQSSRALQKAFSPDVASQTNGRNIAHNLNEAEMAQIEEAAQDYESVFLSEMLSHMFKDVNFDPLYGDNSSAQNIYKSHLIQEYGKVLSNQGGIGLADALKDQLIELQMNAKNRVEMQAVDKAATAYTQASAREETGTALAGE